MIPPLTHKIFSIPEILWKTGGFPYQVFRFGPVRQNFFSTIPWCPPLLCMKIFDTRIFLEHKRVPLRIFSALWDKKKVSTENSEIPFLCIKFFDTRNFWNIEGFPKNFFGTVRQKVFDGKLWYPLSLSHIFFHISENFLEHRRDAKRNFSVPWDKIFSTKP